MLLFLQTDKRLIYIYQFIIIEILTRPSEGYQIFAKNNIIIAFFILPQTKNHFL